MEGTGKKTMKLVPPKGMAVTLLYLSVVTQDLGPGGNKSSTFLREAVHEIT